VLSSEFLSLSSDFWLSLLKAIPLPSILPPQGEETGKAHSCGFFEESYE